jgi:hypothetical protein
LYTLFKAKKKTVGQNRKREKYQKGEKRKMSLASKVTGTDCGTGTGTGAGTGVRCVPSVHKEGHSGQR